MPEVRPGLEDYVAGFCDGYYKAVAEVLELLEVRGPGAEKRDLDHRRGVIKRALKLLALLGG